MENHLLTEILKQLCYHRDQMFIAFGLFAALWVVSAVGLVVIPSGSGAYTITVLNVGTLSLFLVVSGTLLAVCSRTDLRYR